jgi:hypothetical protein
VPGRALVVCPCFPPVNTPDHHRVRVSLPYYREFGWDVEVLAVRPDRVESAQDPTLLRTVPTGTVVHHAEALPARWSRRCGLGDLGLRALPGLNATAGRLLARRRFDLAFFSTTVFPALALGPLWRRRFGLPYVVDFQDPWRSDYYAGRTHLAPGGRWKYGLSQLLARALEPAVVRRAAHVLTVSPRYPRDLRRHYPEVPARRFTVLPFAAAESDFGHLAGPDVRQRVFDPADGLRHVVYAGVVPSSMAKAVEAFLLAVARLRESRPAELARLRFHFVGTSYAPGARGPGLVGAAAQRLGVADLVEEVPQRVPYLQGLALLRDSHAVLVIGSDDPGYSPSKVFPCVLSRRPILAVLHRESSACDLIERCRAGEVVRFDAAMSAEEVAVEVAPALARALARPAGAAPDTEWGAFAPYTAREMTRRQCAVFDAAMAARPGVGGNGA